MLLAVVLSGCAADECFAPRTGAEDECVVSEGGQWDFYAGEPIKGLEALCKASCIDVSRRVSIFGYSDLRDVPLLAKFRTVQHVVIDVEGMRDLSGLEQVDVTGTVTLQTHGGDMTSFKSLDGLVDRRLEGLRFDLVLGLPFFEGSTFDELESFSAESCAFERIDLSSLRPKHVSLNAMEELTELKLGSGSIELIGLFGASQLASFSWQPGLQVRTFIIQNNSALSSCLVRDFVAETKVGNGTVLTTGNGPCP